MNILKQLALIIISTILAVSFMTGAGCTRGSASANSPVTITYNTKFDGETSAGYLKLVVDLNIENTGDATFNTSAYDFAVKVGEYSYVPRDILLSNEDLSAGEILQGTLTFHVPPEAALPKTGFTMTHVRDEQYNIDWVKSSDLILNISSADQTNPTVTIAYITSLMWLDPQVIQYLEIKPPGALFLVVEMIIENQGYESFPINSDNFSVNVSSPILTTTADVQKELIDWRELAIPNGGKHIGSLVFPVPTQVAQSFYKWDYMMIYKGNRAYDIEWTELKVATLKINMDKTDLKVVDLKDGQSLEGKLAFKIASELATDDAVYEMSYDFITDEVTHNIQWFDRPDAVNDFDRNPISYPVIKVTYLPNVIRDEELGLFLIVDLLIENKGYDSFVTTPGYFGMQVRYVPPQ